jgi:uncharacterized protein
VSATGAPEILRASRRRARAWKNGGGLTREIAAAPAGIDLEHFDWRVSTAEVRRAGPFSPFPGIDRTLCMLAGELLLSIAGHTQARLSAQSAPFEFAGELPAYGEPLSGPVADLNVMTRRAGYAARLTRRQADGAPLTLSAETTLIFALTNLGLSAAQVPFTLSRWDAARFSGEARCTLKGAAADAAFYLIEISPPGMHA